MIAPCLIPTALAASAVVFASALPAQQAPHVAPREDREATEAMVFHAFPEADSYSRIVRDVDQAARKEIERRLPFKVHFDELGAHTMFVAFRGRRPVGLLYLRSEESEWGLMELAWALTLDVRVHGFRFQRGRHHGMHELESSPFGKALAGRDLRAVVTLLEGIDTVHADLVPPGEGALTKTVLRSCTKAMLVLDTVWRDEISKLQDTDMGYAAFPSAARFPRHTAQFGLGVGDTQQTVTVKVVHARGTGDFHLGSVIRTEADLQGERVVLQWVVDPELRILRVVPPRSWDDHALRIACVELEGHALSSPPDDRNPLAPLARGLGAVLPELGTGRSRR